MLQNFAQKTDHARLPELSPFVLPMYPAANSSCLSTFSVLASYLTRRTTSSTLHSLPGDSLCASASVRFLRQNAQYLDRQPRHTLHLRPELATRSWVGPRSVTHEELVQHLSGSADDLYFNPLYAASMSWIASSGPRAEKSSSVKARGSPELHCGVESDGFIMNSS